MISNYGMVSRYDAFLVAIPIALLVGTTGDDVLAGVAEWLPVTSIGLLVALALVGRALFATPVE